jgi:hypothetical protein
MWFASHHKTESHSDVQDLEASNIKLSCVSKNIYNNNKATTTYKHDNKQSNIYAFNQEKSE